MKKLMTAALMLSMSWQTMAADSITEYAKYRKAVHEVSQMDNDPVMRKLVKEHGLNIMNVTWEDTGRSQNSSLGPNISDMTIQAHIVDDSGDIEPVAMPVIRYNNFNDKTADISPNKFKLLVGNENGEKLQYVSLTEYLDNFRNYLSLPESWLGEETSLLAPRDTHVLVSAQMAMLPVPQGGKAHFNPVLFNYQSSKDNPAVLTILVTREGTSATIIDNTRDSFEKRGWGQRLFFNANGEKASLTAERQTDFFANIPANVRPDTRTLQANQSAGMNMVMLIQVPLKHKERPIFVGGGCLVCMEAVPFLTSTTRKMDDAVIGHGPVEGPFVEVDNMKIERDERFPVRVTVQFYKATASSKLTAENVQSFRKQIDEVYKNADFIGSLVTEGKTGRPTEHQVQFQYPIWWPIIWPAFYEKTGLKEEDAIKRLKEVYGTDWVRMTKSQVKFEKALELISEK